MSRKKYNWTDITIGDLYKKFKDGNLIVDREYQRDLVWEKTRKNCLISDICLGKAIPPVIFYVDDSDPENTIYEIIDGQQRLLTLFAFRSSDKEVLEKISKISKENVAFTELSKSAASILNNNKTYSAFDEETKRAFNNYKIIVINITSSKNDAIERFVAMNTSAVSLNPHEIRRAKNNNKEIFQQIKKLSKEMREYMYWSTSSSQIRKLDEEFILWIYQVTNFEFNVGIPNEGFEMQLPSSTKSTLDKMCQSKNRLEKSEIDKIKKMFSSANELISDAFKSQFKGKGYFILVCLLIRANELNFIKDINEKILDDMVKKIMNSSKNNEFEKMKLIRISAKTDREKTFINWIDEMGLRNEQK